MKGGVYDFGIYQTGTVYTLNGKCHRGFSKSGEQLPAIILHVRGVERVYEWRRYGLLHRDDGPAIVTYEGGRSGDDSRDGPSRHWYWRGLLHRPLDGPYAGPAIEPNYESFAWRGDWYQYGVKVPSP
jgi:hypothetical protein